MRPAALERDLTEDSGVWALRNPRREVDVVRGEVLGDADVGDARGERTLPTGGDLVDGADIAGRDSAAGG